MTPFESKVEAVMKAAQIADRDRAIAIVRRNFPGLEGQPAAPRVEPKSVSVDDREPPIRGFIRDPDIDEDEEQVEVMTLFRAYGAVVRSTSQKRPSKVALGIADLIVMFPTRGFALWWETKRQVGGKQRPDQAAFERDCRAAGWTYKLGDRYDAARYLLNLGLAEEGDGPLGILPSRGWYCARCHSTLSLVEEAKAHDAAGHVVNRLGALNGEKNGITKP